MTTRTITVFLALLSVTLVRGEPDSGKTEPTDAVLTEPPGSVLFVGGPLIADWTSVRQDFPQERVLNRGLRVAQLGDWNRYLDQIIAVKPRLVVLCAGEEELLRGESPQSVLTDFSAFREGYRAALPRTPLIFMAIMERRDTDHFRELVRETNKLIAAECARDPFSSFVEIPATMRGPGGGFRPGIFRKNSVELSPEGYLVWARHLVQFMRNRPIVEIDLTKSVNSAGFRVVSPKTNRLEIEWPTDDQGTTAVMNFNFDDGARLIDTIAWRGRANEEARDIARELEPSTVVTVGVRNNFNAWTVFFDKPYRRLYQRTNVVRQLTKATVEARGNRLHVVMNRVIAGTFEGRLEFTFYAGVPLVRADTVLKTEVDDRAIFYDAGLVAPTGQIAAFKWIDPATREITSAPADVSAATRMTQYRTVVAETQGGSVAVFPPPHQYIYPLDFAVNLGYNWTGRDYNAAAPGEGWGVRLPAEGDKRSAPWANAPPGTEQRMALFYLIDPRPAAMALEQVKAYTRADEYLPLPGYRTLASHFHLEHTRTLLKQQETLGTTSLPADMVTPGFVRKFRESGVDIVHLAEFHSAETPRLDANQRLRELGILHAECERLSDDTFLLLPGEEPNVHLGGHWISLFPRPVNWVLNRPKDKPFVETLPETGKVYHVGDADDVLKLIEAEGGLMWTAHPRIKSSIGFPDRHRDSAFFTSPRFLGAAWKSMPVDYSHDRLGSRVLDLLDEFANWGAHKQVLGEVDIFKVEPDFELYAHGNVNYLKLDQLPRFTDGWQPVLDALRQGQFFVTTGEVLIPDFTVNGLSSGQTLKLTGDASLRVKARLLWTFPLHHAEIIGGDGTQIFRKRIDLTSTKAFGTTELDITVAGTGWRWIRLEVWDEAVNGAFTQPVWIE